MIILRQKHYSEKRNIIASLFDPETQLKRDRVRKEKHIKRAIENPNLIDKVIKKINPKYGTTAWASKKRTDFNNYANWVRENTGFEWT